MEIHEFEMHTQLPQGVDFWSRNGHFTSKSEMVSEPEDVYWETYLRGGGSGTFFSASRFWAIRWRSFLYTAERPGWRTLQTKNYWNPSRNGDFRASDVKVTPWNPFNPLRTTMLHMQHRDFNILEGTEIQKTLKIYYVYMFLRYNFLNQLSTF